VQFHGKWPFHRFLGMQEPASVLFSLGNLYAHYQGLNSKVRPQIPASYGLRPYYEALAYVGMASWIASAVFHTRDFDVTEKLDYFAAGASVLYGLYYAPIRLFRLDRTGSPDPRVLEKAVMQQPKKGVNSTWILPLWTLLCLSLYAAHVLYLTLWTWDYGYNMGANIAVGVVQNLLWSWFSLRRVQQKRHFWAATPGLVVAWVMLAMSLELLDFPPIWGILDAHSLWHLGTIAPTVLWYKCVGSLPSPLYLAD
jgi:post-GPI attachment to proteins factor 3